VITYRDGALPWLTAFNDTGHLTGDLRPAGRS
jgi:hypothetical protein